MNGKTTFMLIGALLMLVDVASKLLFVIPTYHIILFNRRCWLIRRWSDLTRRLQDQCSYNSVNHRSYERWHQTRGRRLLQDLSCIAVWLVKNSFRRWCKLLCDVPKHGCSESSRWLDASSYLLEGQFWNKWNGCDRHDHRHSSTNCFQPQNLWFR